MDFTKLSSSKRQTKLSKRAQASLDQNMNDQVRAKRKTFGDDSPSPVPPKRGKLTSPNGAHHEPPTHASDAASNPRSANNTSLASSSLGLTDGDTVSPLDGPSDTDTVPLQTGEGGGSGVNSLPRVIVVGSSDDDDDVEMVHATPTQKSRETVEKELSTCLVKHLISIHQYCCYRTINGEMDITSLRVFSSRARNRRG